MMDEEAAAAVVIDNGTAMIKCGFSGDDSPKAIFPSIVGRPKTATAMQGGEAKDCYIGEEAQAKRGVLLLKYPIEHGIICNWDDMEKIWQDLYAAQLQVEPSDHPVLLTESPANPKGNRERTIQIFMDTLNSPALYLQSGGVLAMYAAGRTTGLSLDTGAGAICLLPIYEGYGTPAQQQEILMGGMEVTDYLAKILTEDNIQMTTSAEREIVSDIKEKLCYVALEPEEELVKYSQGSDMDSPFEMPDGNIITIKSGRYRAPECMFNPSLIGKETGGMHTLLFNCINACSVDLRKDYFENIIVTGGNTMFEGFAERITKELTALAPATVKVKVVAAPERKYSVWIGGSILSSLSSFQQQWISKGEYDDSGPTIVHQKCPH